MNMEARIYEVEGKDQGKLKKLLDKTYDEKGVYLKPCFATIGYKLKEGKGVGGEAGKYYLYIKTDEENFKWVGEQLKALPEVKRAAKEFEAKIIAAIEAEDNAAEVGMGAIFG